MNKFAKVILVNRFRRVNYYTVLIEGEQDSLFKQFLNKHTEQNREKLNHLMRWIQKIGNSMGAKVEFFRNEAESADTSALPPTGIDRDPTYVEYGENVSNNLRLYCFRANEHVVFLFNGDIKTAIKAQDCDNVRPHFRLANRITKCIEDNFGDEIKWNEDNTDILFDEDFELNW